MSTTDLVLAFVVVIAVAVFAVVAKEIAKPGKEDTDCISEGRRSSPPAERWFLGVLDGALPEGIAWMGKVRLGDVFVTRKGLQPAQRTRAWNRINQKHVDFLLVRTTDFAPVAGIELDDRSHDADDRKKRDAVVDDVFRSCGMPLLHVPAQQAYNRNELRAKIAALVEPKPVTNSAA